MKKRVNENILILILFLGYCMIYIDKMTISYTIIPIAKEIGISDSQKGVIMSAFFLGYAIMQIPMGFISNKIGSKKILYLSIFLVGIFALFFGFGTSLIFFIIIRFLAGFIAHSGYPASAGKQLTLNVSEDKRTFAQGILLASSGIAGVVAPMILSPIINNFGWKSVYYALAAVAILVSLLLFFIIPNDRCEVSDSKDSEVEGEKASMKAIISDPNVIILFVSLFFLNCVAYGLANWMPSFFSSERGYTMALTAKISSIAGIFSLVGSIGGSYFIGKYLKGKEKKAAFSGLAISGICLVILYFSSTVVLSTIFLSLANFFIIISFVTIMSMPFRLFKGVNFTPSYAAVSTGGILGGFIAPMLIGYLVQSSGNYLSSFIFFGIAAFIAAIAVLHVKK